MRRAIPWLLAGALVASLFAGQIRTSAARDKAIREQGRSAMLDSLLAVAREDAAAARERTRADSATAASARREADSTRIASDRRIERTRALAVAAGRAEREAAGQVRAMLETAGLPTASLDTMEAADRREAAAHADEVLAITADRDAQEARAVASESYASQLMRALDAADERDIACAAANESLRRQAQAWERVARPGLLRRLATEAGRAAVYGGLGYVAGALR